MQIVVYTYYGAPGKLESGDDVRIHGVCKSLKQLGTKVTVYNLSQFTHHYTLTLKNDVIYVSIPRKLYKLITRILRWSKHYDLNLLIKLTHYIDELIATIKLHRVLEKADAVIIFGSMSLSAFMLRLLKFRKTIVYDPLANYAQTLYLRSRKNLAELLRYGLYLVLHKLQIRSSDIVVYPSKIDLENAIQMFKPTRSFIVPNPLPICFNSLEEYASLRGRRREHSRVYFVLLAGGKGRGNEEAVRTTIEVFNGFPPEEFRLIITGPWQDLKKLVRNPSIELVGVVSTEKLKEILAMSDYGLSPIYSHCAGTFLKVLAYIASGLNIIASPHSLQGIELTTIHDRLVLIVRNKDEYKRAAEKALMTGPRIAINNVITCQERDNLLKYYTKKLVEYLKTYR